MFKQLTRYTSQGNWALIAHKRPVIFFEKWADICERLSLCLLSAGTDGQTLDLTLLLNP